MGYYVLLQFDDVDDADKFLHRTREERVVLVDDRTFPNSPITELDCSVRGVWRYPTKFCDCKTTKHRGFTRGKKYGWWVCSQCKRPTVGWGRGDHWFLALGRNLLPVDQNAPEYRGDGVFARHHEPCKTCGTMLMTQTGHAEARVWCPTCEEWR